MLLAAYAAAGKKTALPPCLVEVRKTGYADVKCGKRNTFTISVYMYEKLSWVF